MANIKIEELTHRRFSTFTSYFNRHLSENGQNGWVFQPLSRRQSVFDQAIQERFKEGIGKEFGELGWRKLWVARLENNQVIGHIDIRHPNHVNAFHRVMLGMGVDSTYRKQGVGQHLLSFVIAYCQQHPQIKWIDLEVMAHNTPAIRLYHKLGFTDMGTTVDMFRIEGQSYDYTYMTLQV